VRDSHVVRQDRDSVLFGNDTSRIWDDVGGEDGVISVNSLVVGLSNSLGVDMSSGLNTGESITVDCLLIS